MVAAHVNKREVDPVAAVGRTASMSHLSIDIGSEFIDIALGSRESCRVCKVLIGERGGVDAAMAGIDAALASWSLSLAQVATVRVASTEAVNALLGRSGPRVALVTTQGFGDCLSLGRQNRAHLYNPIAVSPAPTFLVARQDTFEVAGRIDAQGVEVAPLDERAVRAVAREMRARGIETVAVCLLFSQICPDHERRCREVIHEEVPQARVCLSHEVDPQPREYERTVSVCLEAWLRPAIERAMSLLRVELSRRGFAGSLLFADARGDLLDFDAANACVSPLLANGPAASARCAANAARAVEASTAIALDMGSTSTDLCLIDKGAPRTCHNTVYAGVPLRQAMLDVVSIDLGGRSHIVRDNNGRLAFSAARGGPEGATLSSALLVAGRIPDDRTIDKSAAWAAFGGPIGSDEARAAACEAVEAAERKGAAGILDYAVKRNVDPALTALIGMGGLGGILGPAIAALLRIPRFVCPSAPAAAGALGLLASQPRFEATARIGAWTDSASERELQAVVERLAGMVRDRASAAGRDQALALRTTVEIASNPHMHPQHVTLEGLPRNTADIAAAFRTQHVDSFGTVPPERAFLFSLTVQLVALGNGPFSSRGLAAPVTNAAYAEPMLLETAAGAIWKPPGWSLTRVSDCYVLRPEAGQ